VKITETDVRYVAGLANLDLSEEETKRFAADLDAILGYVQKLNQLDTSNVEPMAQVLFGSSDEVMRPDETQPSLPQDLALANAPEKGVGHFKVPKVIER